MRNTHWTDKSTEDYLFRIGADFISQVEAKLGPDVEQKQLAEWLNISESAVSQMLNNPGNLKIKTMISYARALHMKLSVLLYDDGDGENENGPIHPDIFRICWERCGKPADFVALSDGSEVAKDFVPAKCLDNSAWTKNIGHVRQIEGELEYATT